MIDIGWHDISMSDYHTDIDTYSKSSIADFFEKGPLKFRHQRLNPPTQERKRHFDFGTAFHTMVLEPHLFDSTIAIIPEKNGKTISKNSTAYKDFAVENSDKAILSAEELQTVQNMYESVMHKTCAKELLSGGISEVTGVFDHPKGVRIKFRPDYMPCGGMMVDLKTTSYTGRAFVDKAYQFKYHWSAYMSMLGAKALGQADARYIFVVVDKEPPHDVAIYELSDAMIAAAEIEVESTINELAECINSDVWTGSPDAIQQLDAPIWVKRRYFNSDFF